MITVLVTHTKSGLEWKAEVSERSIVGDLIQHSLDHFSQRGISFPPDKDYAFEFRNAEGSPQLTKDTDVVGDLPYEGQESTRIIRVRLVRLP